MPQSRRVRGEGSVFKSAAKGCWIWWRACTGFKTDGSVRHTEGRARTQGAALRAKQATEKACRVPSQDATTVGWPLPRLLGIVHRVAEYRCMCMKL